MFDGLFQNVKSGFNKLKGNVVAGASNVKDAFSDAIDFSTDLIKNDAPEYTNRVTQALEQQNRRDVEEGANSIMQWFNNYQQKEADAGRFSPLNLSKLGEYNNKKKAQKDYEEELFNEGIFNKSDMSLFDKGLKSVEERTISEIDDNLLNIPSGIVKGVNRAVLALHNNVLNSLDYINDKTGLGYKTEDSARVGASIDFLESVNPEISSRFKDFFGIKEGQDNEVNYARIGEDWNELTKLVGVDIDKNMLPAVGFVGSMLDVFPGASGEKNFLKKVIQESKNADEILLALKSVAKGSDEDLSRFATKLFESKGDSAVGIWKMIEDENAGQSSIKFLKGKNIEKNIEKVLSKKAKEDLSIDVGKKVDTNIDTVDEMINNQDYLKSLGFSDSQLDDVAEGMVSSDNLINNIKKIPEDELPDFLKNKIKELKSTYNISYLDEASNSVKIDLLDLISKNKEEILNGKNTNPKLSDYVRRGLFGLSDNADELPVEKLRDFFRIISEQSGARVKRIIDSAYEGSDSFIDNIYDVKDDSLLGNLQGQSLQSRQVFSELLSDKLTNTQKAFRKATSNLKEQGLQKEEIKNLFNEGFKSRNITYETAKIDDIVSIYKENAVGTFWDFLERYRYTNILSGIATHAVNVNVGMLDNVIVNPGVRLIEGFFDLLSGKGGDSINGVGKYYANLFSADNLNRSWSKAVKAFNQLQDFRGVDLPATPDKIKIFGKAVSTKAFGYVARALSAQDSFMREAIGSSLNKEKLLANGFREVGKGKWVDKSGINVSNGILNKIKGEAYDEARDNIFIRDRNDPNLENIDKLTGLFADGVQEVDTLTNKLIKDITSPNVDIRLMKWFLPFLDTGSRVVSKKLQITPLGLLDLVNAKNPKKVIAKTIFGTGIMVAGMELYKKDREAWKFNRGKQRDNPTSTKYSDNEGNKYNSLRVGETWHDVGSLGSISGPIMLGGLVQKAIDEGRFDVKDKDLANAFAQYSSTIFALLEDEASSSISNEFLGSISGFADWLQGEKNSATYLSGVARQMIPFSSLIGSFNRAFVDNEKKVTPQNFIEALEYLQRDIPGLSQNLTQKTDPDGIPLYYGDKENDPFKSIQEFISPTRPAVRDENVHNKYLQEREREDLRKGIKEGDKSTKTTDQRDFNMIDSLVSGTATREEKNSYVKRLNELGQAGVADLIHEYENRNESQGSRYIHDIVNDRGTKEAKDFIKNSSPELVNVYLKEYKTREVGRLKLLVEKIALGKSEPGDKGKLLKADPELLQKAITSYEKSLEL